MSSEVDRRSEGVACVLCGKELPEGEYACAACSPEPGPRTPAFDEVKRLLARARGLLTIGALVLPIPLWLLALRDTDRARRLYHRERLQDALLRKGLDRIHYLALALSVVGCVFIVLLLEGL
jgi:hypothetical protein